MPPQPPEETSVLSHRSVPDSEPRLAIHPKDPLAYTSSQNIGLKGHHRNMHAMECNPMVQQQQQQAQYNYEDQQAAIGDRAKSHYNQSTYGQGVVHSTKNSQHLSISTMLQNGMQPRRESSFPGTGARLDPSLMPPTPTMTPVGVPNLSKEYIEAAHGRTHSSHYFDFSPHHQQLQQQPPQTTYRYPPVPSSQDFPNRNSSSFGNTNGYHPQTPCSSTPNFASVNDSPGMETYHSANASPFFHPHPKQQPSHDYGSLPPSPLDLAARARHYRSSEQDAILDATAVQAASLAVAPPPPYAPVAQSYGLKSSPVSLWKKTAWVFFTLAIFMFPYMVLKACFHLQVSAGAWQTSITYGMLMTVDFICVITFSGLNRRRVNQRVRKRDPHWVGLTTGILAVGYREDPTLLEGCLKSLRAIRYQRNQRVMLVVDGNESQDEYMAQIFLKVFEKQGPAVFRPDFLCMDREASDKAREDLVRQIAYHPGPVCVMQPHRGKRSAMYTGFAALLQQGIESVVVTDSDTYLDPRVCKELAFALAESPIIGAATGDVRIYNTGTWVSFLSSLRYWFAFNLERGAQSYHSVVNCVSGPLGIYRMSIVADVMDSWVKQSFLGVLCTYGDDRHLTNLVLREGYKVKFSHHAVCYTDTPIRFIAWVTQQTRWSKSFFREIPIQLGCMHLHSPWMTYALLYQLIYPMMMIYNLVNCIYFGTGSQISWWLVSIALVGVMKTAYAVKLTGDKKFFFTTIYGFLYMLGYVPAKVYAALTLYDNSWGTSARLIRNFTQLQSYIAPVTWGSILFFGVLHNPSRYSQLAPLAEGQPIPMLTDVMVCRALLLFGLAYFVSFLWFFVRTGVITRDYKRDFSYEELFENMTSYTLVDGGKRKVARFEV